MKLSTALCALLPVLGMAREIVPNGFVSGGSANVNIPDEVLDEFKRRKGLRRNARLRK